MKREEATKLTEKFLSAWNDQDVNKVLSCYTEDCTYLDPNTKGAVSRHEALRKYLSKLFQQWKMHWSLREFFLLHDENGVAFLWHAQLTPARGGKTFEIDGMDLVIVRKDRMHRNEIYFDRMALFTEK